MLFDVFDRLAANLIADLSEFHGLIQVTPLRNFNPTPPSIDIYPADPSRETFETAGFNEIGGELDVTIRARVTTADSEAGQRLLLRFMDDQDTACVAASVIGDQTLGGLTSSIYVDGFTGFELHDGATDGGPLLGVRWHARVLRVIT